MTEPVLSRIEFETTVEKIETSNGETYSHVVININPPVSESGSSLNLIAVSTTIEKVINEIKRSAQEDDEKKVISLVLSKNILLIPGIENDLNDLLKPLEPILNRADISGRIIVYLENRLNLNAAARANSHTKVVTGRIPLIAYDRVTWLKDIEILTSDSPTSIDAP